MSIEHRVKGEHGSSKVRSGDQREGMEQGNEGHEERREERE